MKTLWEVTFKGRFAPVIVKADTFLDAVAEASKMDGEIIAVAYLAY